MDSRCRGVSRFYSTMEIWVQEIMAPEELLQFRETCWKVHRVVTAENMLVAKFAVSRWYSAHGSLTFGRLIRKQCVQAAALNVGAPTCGLMLC